MNSREVKNKLQAACNRLYANEKNLIDEESNELTIVSYLVSYLRDEIKDWDIDQDYRREGIDRTPKRDLSGNIIIPDIAIHKRGPDGPNLAAVEVKGYWNKENRAIDKAKLKAIQLKHHYRFLFRIELLNEGFEIIQAEDAIQ